MATRRTGLTRVMVGLPALLTAGIANIGNRLSAAPTLTAGQQRVQQLYNEITESGWYIQWSDLSQYGGRGIALIANGRYAAAAQRVLAPGTLDSQTADDLRLLTAAWQQVQEGAALVHTVAEPLLYRWIG